MPIKAIQDPIAELDPPEKVVEKKPRVLVGSIVLPGQRRTVVVDAAQLVDVRRGLKPIERGA